MGDFCGYMNYYEAYATFLLTGRDVLLFDHPDEEFINQMNIFIHKGIIMLDLLKHINR